MKKINILRKFVHAIMFRNRLESNLKEVYDNFSLATLKEFCNTYDFSNTALQQYVYEGIKVTYSSVYHTLILDS
jgi:hypothetical protein